MKNPNPNDEHFAVSSEFQDTIASVSEAYGWTPGQIGAFMIGIGSHLLCAEVGATSAIKTLRTMEPVLQKQCAAPHVQ